MKQRTYIIFALLALLLEGRLRLWGLGPSLLVIFPYTIGLRQGPMRGIAAGAGFGFLRDALGGGLIGPGIVSLSLVGYLVSYLRGGLFFWTPLLGFLGLGVLTAVDGLTSYACYSAFGQPHMDLSDAAWLVFWQAVMNSALGFFLKPERTYDV